MNACEETSFSTGRTGGTPNARILLIDDDPALLESLAEMLRIRLEQVQIETCSNPALAVAVAQRGSFDLILCDVRMPQMNGLTLLPQLRGAAPHAAIVMMSGMLDDTVRSRAFAYGATTFLAKPFDRESLTINLKQALKNRRLSQTRSAASATSPECGGYRPSL